MLFSAGAAGASPATESLSRVAALVEAGDLEPALEMIDEITLDELPVAEQIEATRRRHQILHKLGRYADAQEAGERWLALVRNAANPAEEIEALRAVAGSYAALRKSERNAELLDRALELASASSDSRLQLEVLIENASARALASEFSAAAGLLDRAEARIQALRPRDLELEAKLFGARGVMHSYQGDPARAVVFHEQAVERARATGDPALLSPRLLNLGQAQTLLHDYAGCLASLHEALEIGLPDSERSIILVSTGICHLELNQWEEAEDLFEQGRLAAEKIDSPRVVGWAIGELAIVAWKNGNDFERAMELFKEAEAISASQGDARNRLAWLANQAAVRRDQGRCEESLAIRDEIIRATRAIPGLHVSAAVLKNAAECLVRLGRFDEAEATLAEALAVARERGDGKRVWQGEQELARLRVRQERRGEADKAYSRALAALEDTRGSLRLEAFKADFFSDKLPLYEEYLNFLLEESDAQQAAARSFEVAERSRARAFLDILAESRVGLHETLPADVVAAEERIGREISTLQAELRRSGPDPERSARLEAGEKALEDLTLRVRTSHPRFRDIRYAQTVSVRELQAALMPGEALAGYMLAEPASHAWLVRRDGIEYRGLPGKAQLETMLRSAMAGLFSPKGDPGDLRMLGRLLLGSSAELPARLLIVPSGLLYYFPFEILPVGPGNRILAEQSATVYLPSATALVELRRRPVSTSRTRMLALGDPVYSGEGTGRSASSALASLGALPHTRREVERVRSLFGGRYTRTLLGEQATEQSLKAEPLESFSVLHLAAHGWLDDEHPERSGIVVGDDPKSSEDGLLQVREIFRLPLAADLIVLSACRSALGDLVTGEGMVGLTRGFLYAGTDSVVASLWNVDDEASSQFMTAFYRSLRSGNDKAEALRLARLEIRGDPRYAHPYYWAPYVLIGRGDTAVTFAPRSKVPWWLAGGGLVVFTGFGLWLAIRRKARA